VLGSAVGVGAAVVAGAEAVGPDDGVGADVAVESVGDGLGLGDELVQKMIRTQVCVGVGVGVASCAARARPPQSPMTAAVHSTAARVTAARRFMPAPPRSPGPRPPA
jgi:hypothetical protein